MWLLPWLVAAGLLARLAAQIWLTRLNAREARRHRGAIPRVFEGMIEPGEYARTIEYTLAKARFSYVENVFDAILLALVIFSGVLPWAWGTWTGSPGPAAWSGALFLVVMMLVISLPGLPLEWWSQFRLEERFGFNRCTVRLWVSDKLKGALVGIVIGFPLLWLLLKLVDWIGDRWWLAGWAVLVVFQLVMIVLYPMLILPLFNKLTPLPDGDVRRRLMELAGRTAFPTATIQVMDGSKRSAHSNAFFTGFGRFRRIVLFDTLLQQLTPEELEAVLAHEIGHYKLGHIPRMLMISAVSTLGAFALIGWLAASPGFFDAFGFSAPSLPVAFLLFGLLAGIPAFWLTPMTNALSRRHEYQADAFARKMTGGAGPIIAALRKLSKKNLSNLTPHPLFSGFYYSHPTLAERETAVSRG
ncbi:MAG: M48 family metallopeptidase [Opitutaceae bacterium]